MTAIKTIRSKRSQEQLEDVFQHLLPYRHRVSEVAAVEKTAARFLVPTKTNDQDTERVCRKTGVLAGERVGGRIGVAEPLHAELPQVDGQMRTIGASGGVKAIGRTGDVWSV